MVKNWCSDIGWQCTFKGKGNLWKNKKIFGVCTGQGTVVELCIPRNKR